MKLRVAAYRMRTWLRHQLTARHTGGHGVHSPSLFELVRMIMMDNNRYYYWAEIEKLREKLLADERALRFVDYGSGARERGEQRMRQVRAIAGQSLARKKYARLLARLVNWLGGKTCGDGNGLNIVELGTSLGVTTAYLAAMDSRNRVLTMEGCEAVAAVAKENWQSLQIRNIECQVGEIDAARLSMALDRVFGAGAKVDLAYVDASHTCASTRAFFNLLAERMSEKGVIVVDDIHYNADMEEAWLAICGDERVTSTMDLYQMGWVFFDRHYWKRDYKIRI